MQRGLTCNMQELYTYMYIYIYTLYTLPETDIAPKDGWLEYYFPLGEAYFQEFLLLVSGSVVIFVTSFDK